MSAITKEKMEQKQEEGFAEYMAKDSTKVLIGLIPEGENREGLKALLRGSYDAGYGSGIAAIMIGMLDSMIKDGTPR